MIFVELVSGRLHFAECVADFKRENRSGLMLLQDRALLDDA